MKLVNFDYDGVIVDSLEQLLDLSIQAQARLALGRPPTLRDFATIENLSFDNLARLVGFPERQVPQFVSTIFDLQCRDERKLGLFPGIPETLRRLAETCSLVVITASQSASVRRVLDKNGLGQCFSMILGGELGLTKAQRIAKARSEFGADAKSTYMVGDTINDIRQGKLAGVKTVGVSWGFQERGLLERELPDFLIDRPEELVEISA